MDLTALNRLINRYQLASGMWVRVSYDRMTDGRIGIEYHADRQPTAAERAESDALMFAIVANSPYCRGRLVGRTGEIHA